MSPQVKKTDQELHPENYFLNPTGHIRDRVIFHENQDIPKQGIFISLNGYSFQVKPNVEVDMPRPVLRMLDTRIRTDTFYDDEGKPYYKDIPRYTYSVITKGVNAEQAEEERNEIMDA